MINTNQQGGVMIQKLLLLFLLAISSSACAGEPQKKDDSQKKQLIDIMKTVNFVPQLGKDDPFCRTFYEDFKTQANIEHIKPIVKADKYDDPKLKPYQSKCPKLKIHKMMAFHHRDLEIVGEPIDEADAESRAVEINYGMNNFQLFKVDINNHPGDGEEYVLYYEGEFDQKLNKAYPANRAYRVVDLTACRIIGGVYFNRGGSAKWTRNGVIRYKGKNAIYELISTSQREYYYLTLHMYSDRLKRIAPTCSYHKPLRKRGE